MSFFAGQIVTAALLNAPQRGTFAASIAANTTSKDTPITFPVAFTATPTGFQVSVMEAAGGGWAAIVTALSATGATIRVFVTSGVASGSAHTVTVLWEAAP